MSVSLFENVATVYNNSASAKIIRHRIEHPALGRFCVSLSSLSSQLGELANDDYWRKLLVPLKRLQFSLCAAPRTVELRSSRVKKVLEKLQGKMQLCPQLYPDFAAQAITIHKLLEDLSDDSTNPLLDKLLELTEPEYEVAWVIKESRFIPHVEKLTDALNLPQLHVLHPFLLKGPTCYQNLIVVGPSRWFPESIFTAARARQIDILIFDWINDRWKPRNVFVAPRKSFGPSKRKSVTIEERDTYSHWDEIDPESFLTIVDKTSSVTSTLNYAVDADGHENVEAICIFLEDDWAVFLEAGEGIQTLVIDPDEDKDDRISRMDVNKTRPGMFILVRTSGGGDYIIPVADRIMGQQAYQFRRYQRHWKRLLREYSQRNGFAKTCRTLRAFGSKIANPVNVQNWMLPRSIRTREYVDFLAIMKLVGLEVEAQEYWSNMERIDSAHRKAGFEIRNLLLEQVRDLDLVTLQKQGKMDFKLSSDDEGGLTAFRIEDIMPKRLEVPYSRIGHPFRLEEQLWRG